MRLFCRPLALNSFISLILLSFFSCNLVHALDFQSARTLGMAQSGRAAPLLADVITLNPSTLGFYPISGISGTYGWQHPSNDLNPFNVGIIDGNNDLFSAGASFTRATSFDFIHLAMAKKVTDIFSLGAHAKRFNNRTTGPGSRADRYVGYDFGLSSTIVLSQNQLPIPLYIGITSDNLSNAHEGVFGARQFGVGLKTNITNIILPYLDYIYYQSKGPIDSQQLNLAAEIAAGADFFLRGGLMTLDVKGWGAGGGWIGPKVGIHYGYQKITSLDAHFEHSITLDIFM